MKNKVFLMVCVLAGLVASAVMGQANDALFDAIEDRNENYLIYEAEKNWSSNRNALMNGKTALMRAAEIGWRRGVEILLRAKADPNVKGDGDKNALMLSALENNDIEIMKLLVANGGNLNVADENKNTILMYAVQNRNTTLLEYLLDRGANPSLRNNDGENAIIVAARVNNGDAVESLLARNIRGINEVSTKNPRKNAFMWACDHDNIEMVRALLPKIDLTVDFPAEARDLDGPLPALLWAINYRKSDSVINEIIYNYPGNLRDVKDRNGRDAMYYAKKENKGVAALTNRVKSYDNAVNTQGGSW